MRIGVVFHGLSAGDVAEGPAQRAEQRQDYRHHRGRSTMCGAIGRDERHPGDRERDSRDLHGGHPLAEQHHTEDRRERRGGLQDQGRQTGRHAVGHGQEQECELDGAESESVEQQPSHRHPGPGNEQDYRQCQHSEPQTRKEQRWEVLQSSVNGHEIDSPQHGDGQSEETVPSSHGVDPAQRNNSAQSN
ncbi:Uncharacterised protein [Mycobacteroides abscessus subsp. massiliense]|nr:Uncharacterised protein [Mycobacteroides abscessus subsp. massiliense]